MAGAECQERRRLSSRTERVRVTACLRVVQMRIANHLIFCLVNLDLSPNYK